MPKQSRKRSAENRSKPPTPESTPEKGSLPKSSDKGIDAPTGRDGSDVPAGRGAADVHSAAAAQLACGSVDVAAKDPDATPEGGPAQQALPPNAAGAGNDSSMTDACPGSSLSGLKSLSTTIKRKRKPSIVKELLSAGEIAVGFRGAGARKCLDSGRQVQRERQPNVWCGYSSRDGTE